METRIESGSYPAEREELQGCLLVNVDVKEKTRSYDGTIDEVYYSYIQLRFPLGETEERINTEVNRVLESQAKQAKQEALDNLTVTTGNGNTFDADGIGRQDMLSAIEASGTLGLTENNWKLADNTWKLIQLDELKEASALAIQAKGAILAGE